MLCKSIIAMHSPYGCCSRPVPSLFSHRDIGAERAARKPGNHPRIDGIAPETQLSGIVSLLKAFHPVVNTLVAYAKPFGNLADGRAAIPFQ